MRTTDRFFGIRAVLCDAVGTLIDAAPSVAQAYAEAAERQGLVLEPSLVRTRFRAAFAADEARALAGPLSTDEALERKRWRNIVTEVMPELPDPERAFEELWIHFSRPNAWRPFEDAAPALRAFEAAGLVVRVASNFDSRLRSVLGGMPELAPWADDLVISSEVGWRKPSAEFYRAACERLGLPPSAVLHVGDHPEHDISGARNAGLQAALVDREGKAKGGSGLVVPKLEVLAEALARRNSAGSS